MLNELRFRPRIALRVPATLRERGRGRFMVRLIDISEGGCRIELQRKLNVGDWVWLKIGCLEAQYCRVAWSQDPFAGLQFAAPLSQAVLDALVSQQPALSARCRHELREIASLSESAAERSHDASVSKQLEMLSRQCSSKAAVSELVSQLG